MLSLVWRVSLFEQTCRKAQAYLQVKVRLRVTKKQLIQELVALQQRLAIYEAVDMQRQQATDVLPASAAHFCLAVDTAPVMVWMSSPDTLNAYVNAPWSLWTGRTFTQELGDGEMEGVHPDDLSSCLETYRAAVQARQPF